MPPMTSEWRVHEESQVLLPDVRAGGKARIEIKRADARKLSITRKL